MLTAALAAFVALILLAVLVRGRQVGGDRSPQLERANLEDPLRVLDEVFARGEIDLTGYQARRTQLRKLERG